MSILVDADGCPVKAEIHRVARRHHVHVTFVTNAPMKLPPGEGIELVITPGDFNAADDWIADHVSAGDIVITADIPLADRCLKKGARVLDHRGGEFTQDNVGDAMASRELMSHMRAMGVSTGGPRPFDRKDRSSFLHKLDEALRKT